jgi:hypothetical protein
MDEKLQNATTLWSRTLFERPTVAKPVKKVPLHFYIKPPKIIMCLQQPTIGPSPEADESSSHSHHFFKV